MRLGLTLQETYLLILAVLLLLATFGTAYGQWALRRATSTEQIDRIRAVNSRVKTGFHHRLLGWADSITGYFCHHLVFCFPRICRTNTNET